MYLMSNFILVSAALVSVSAVNAVVTTHTAHCVKKSGANFHKSDAPKGMCDRE